jgi:hypothetical protein
VAGNGVLLPADEQGNNIPSQNGATTLEAEIEYQSWLTEDVCAFSPPAN